MMIVFVCVMVHLVYGVVGEEGWEGFGWEEEMVDEETAGYR